MTHAECSNMMMLLNDIRNELIVIKKCLLAAEDERQFLAKKRLENLGFKVWLEEESK